LLLVAYNSIKRRSELISLHVKGISGSRTMGQQCYFIKAKPINFEVESGYNYQPRQRISCINSYQLQKINAELIFRGVRSSEAITNCLLKAEFQASKKALDRKASLTEPLLKRISGHSMRVGGEQDLLMSVQVHRKSLLKESGIKLIP
jgi:hypothetical protein